MSNLDSNQPNPLTFKSSASYNFFYSLLTIKTTKINQQPIYISFFVPTPFHLFSASVFISATKTRIVERRQYFTLTTTRIEPNNQHLKYNKKPSASGFDAKKKREVSPRNDEPRYRKDASEKTSRDRLCYDKRKQFYVNITHFPGCH